MAMELPTLEDDLTAEAEAYMVQGTGEKKLTARDEIGNGDLGKQVEQYIADSAATCNMTPNADGLTNY